MRRRKKPYMDAAEASMKMTKPGVRKVIFLDNDSHLTLSVEKNVGELPARQRAFINQLIDEMEDFVASEMAIEEAELQARQRNREPQVSS
jgi:hypothetical protein